MKAVHSTLLIRAFCLFLAVPPARSQLVEVSLERLIEENLRRYVNGDKILTVVDVSREY